MNTNPDVLISMAAALRELPQIVASSAPDVATALRGTVVDTASQGRTAEGVTWEPSKSGGPVLRNAAAHVEAFSNTSKGKGVAGLRITGHYALHDLGRARGGVVRSILPVRVDGKFSRSIAVAIERRLMERIDRVT